MKVKEIERTGNAAWSAAAQYPIYLAVGTAAQQLDASFRFGWLIIINRSFTFLIHIPVDNASCVFVHMESFDTC